jgi:hypothetical protein
MLKIFSYFSHLVPDQSLTSSYLTYALLSDPEPEISSPVTHLTIPESLNRISSLQTLRGSKNVILHFDIFHADFIRRNFHKIKSFKGLTLHRRSFNPNQTFSRCFEMHDSELFIADIDPVHESPDLDFYVEKREPRVRKVRFSKKDVHIALMEQKYGKHLRVSQAKFRKERVLKQVSENNNLILDDPRVIVRAEKSLGEEVTESLRSEKKLETETFYTLMKLFNDDPEFLFNIEDGEFSFSLLDDSDSFNLPYCFDLKLSDFCSYQVCDEKPENCPVCLNRNLSCQRILNNPSESASCAIITPIICALTCSWEVGCTTLAVYEPGFISFPIFLGLIHIKACLQRAKLPYPTCNIPFCPKQIHCCYPCALRDNMVGMADRYPHCLETPNKKF